MSMQSTKIESRIETLDEKANKYKRRIDTKGEVDNEKARIEDLNSAIRKLVSATKDFENSLGILSDVFDEPIPDEALQARKKIRDIASKRDTDLIDIIDNESKSLSSHTEEVRKTRDKVKSATKNINDEINDIQNQKLSEAATTRSVLRIVGGSQEEIQVVNEYESFVKKVLTGLKPPKKLKSEWAGLEAAFDDVSIDWDEFRRQNNLSRDTISVLKDLSDGEDLSLSEIPDENVLSEMMRVDGIKKSVNLSL